MPFTPSPAIPDLWHYLQAADRAGRPIVMYGMGNGADKILAVCDAYGITVRDFFASDGFVRGHSFHGKIVLSFTDVCAKYGADHLIVLVSFATSRSEVLALIERVAAACETYVPDVPVCGDTLFNHEFFVLHQEEIDSTRALLADEASRRVFDGILSYKLSGRLDILRATESNAADAYRDILRAKRFRNIVDLGAYNGDSIREIKAYAPLLAHIIAMEPDRRNFRKLNEYAENVRTAGDSRITGGSCRIHTIQAGAWSKDTVLHFHASGNRNATATVNRPTGTVSALLPAATDKYFGKTLEVAASAPDTVIKHIHDKFPDMGRIDYIKYDVEGAEAEALHGAKRTIKRDAPALLVSVYHRSEDIFTLPLLVHGLNPAYRLYLRRMAGIPAWDINLYAVTE